MKFFTAILALTLALIDLSQASPIEARAAPAKFQLKTKVINGKHKDTGSKKGGLYITSYHTGAGTGIAAGFNASSGSWYYLNDTNLAFTYENNEIGPWRTIIEYGPYQSYNVISISIATNEPSTEGFSLDKNNNLNSTATNGWLMCDTWYTAPQLFALAGYQDPVIPSSCSFVNLTAVAVQ